MAKLEYEIFWYFQGIRKVLSCVVMFLNNKLS